MKFSKAMLCGYQRVGGRQHFGSYCARSDDPQNPRAVCALGARNLCASGFANAGGDLHDAEAFEREWGISVTELNDDLRLPWEHIYGMAVAAGL